MNRIDPLVSNIEIEHSVEARWVLAGRPPHRLVSNLVGQATFERRTDIYMDPSNDDTNVKFRGGRRLQVKLRRWWRRYPFDCGAIGRVEGWTKWSFSDDEYDAAPIAIAGKSGWVSVNKALWILDISGRDAGHVEIGQLAVPDDRSMYWTLCVEVPTETAVGVADAPLHAVCRGLHALEPWLPHDELRLTTPTSYPEWLRSLPPTAGTDSPCRFDAKSPELEASTPRR